MISHISIHGLVVQAPSSSDVSASPLSPSASVNQRYEVYCAYNSLPNFEDNISNLFNGTAHKLHPSIVKMQSVSNIDFCNPNYIHKIQQACGGTVDVIIHLAALSSPFYCESHAEEAWKINCPVELLSLKAPIMYMSTDQVYEGTKQFYGENDETVPVNVYGRTKLAFERILLGGLGSSTLLTAKELGSSTLPEFLTNVISNNLQPHNKSVILRSSLILGKPTPFPNGCRKGFPSFLQFIEDRLKNQISTDYFVNEYRSVVHLEDVIGSIRHFVLKALSPNDDTAADEGVQVFNLGGSTRVSRYELATFVATYLNMDSTAVNGVNRPKEGGGVPSPPDISMNVDKLARELGKKLDGVKEIVETTFG